ncbi:uncharacterized protein LOC117173985 isoform X2 [Belonocnema kinseyi]|uniref:uncharacterized protein LOC117173985 isoform X2 n=1 Tax=Belonocnema kinseyi TaxID=2817044 RepID=UPI00143D949F|nr:uncharacterized protein LOC117173985 isoform X2 [Belonocnema kinseyi]XP_033218556.1 uncharacterized protein LOC117173985 isoform X2 [Belonocnema kinseyi]XP_033218557.1 uncharacterized protein LOC117173985 isoform X2 [Belonocnema kinseyi]
MYLVSDLVNLDHWLSIGTGGFPENYPVQYVLITMEDYYTFEDKIDRYVYDVIPDWMEPYKANYVEKVKAYIRTERGVPFASSLLKSNQPRGHHPSPPLNATLRIGNERYSEYYTTVNFREYTCRYYVPSNLHLLNNHIYVTLPGGPVYAAPLVRYDPSTRCSSSPRTSETLHVTP